MLIVFDGIDGAGKSYHLKLISKWLNSISYPFIFRREPGGTILSEQIRSILMNNKLDTLTQLMLFSISRFENTKNLENHKGLILFDRYIDSTYAYQHEISKEVLDYFVNLTAKIQPDFVFLFLNQHRKEQKNYLDKYSQENVEKIKSVFKERCLKDITKYFIVPDCTKEEQHEILKEKIAQLLKIELD